MLTGYKTLIFNSLSAVLAVVIAFDWSSLGISAQTVGIILGVVNVVNVILRAFTNTPIGTSTKTS